MDRGIVVDVAVSRKAVWGGVIGRRLAVASALALAAAGASACGDVVRQGTGSSYLIINSLEGASGAEPNEFATNLHSDVITVVDDVPTTFNDVGRARFSLGLKDPGGAQSPNTPTTNNFITINRYHVRYIRSDGRNTPGVDVPYPFDGGLTGTVGGSDATFGFELVRHVAKEEAPLRALARNTAVIITTIAEVTFYGTDQTGHEVSVTGRMTIDFGDFGDPK
jgi:hypothetical protein